MAIHVSIAAEKLFDLGPLHVTNSLFTSWIVVGLLVLVAFVIRLSFQKKGAPRGLQNVVEIVLESFYGLIEGTTGSRKLARRFFSVLVTIFIFVLFNNWFGLLPGVGAIGIKEEEEIAETTPSELANPEARETTTEEATSEEVEAHPKLIPLFRAGSADLSFTLALAIIAVVLTQYHGLRELGGKYVGKFFNLHGIHSFVGLLELVSEFSKMISFSFRLFGNVFAGEVLLTVILSLAPFVAPMPFYGLEIFVGAVQAFVFMMLTLVFFKMATVHESH